MIIDALQLLSDAQALTATAYSTNTIDLGNVTPKRDIGAGEPMELTIAVDVAADFTTGNETYQVNFVQSANANLTSDDDLITRVIVATDLPAGAIIHVPIPAGAITKRYIGVEYVLGGTTPTVTVTTVLQPVALANANKNYGYADAITIS